MPYQEALPSAVYPAEGWTGAGLVDLAEVTRLAGRGFGEGSARSREEDSSPVLEASTG